MQTANHHFTAPVLYTIPGLVVLTDEMPETLPVNARDSLAPAPIMTESYNYILIKGNLAELVFLPPAPSPKAAFKQKKLALNNPCVIAMMPASS